jgi:hypothetical protein
MAAGTTKAEIIRTGVRIRVWLQGLRNENRNNGWSLDGVWLYNDSNRNNKDRSSDQSMATETTKTEKKGWSSVKSMVTGTTKTEKRAGVQLRVWLQGLRKQKKGLEFS